MGGTVDLLVFQFTVLVSNCTSSNLQQRVNKERQGALIYR